MNLNWRNVDREQLMRVECVLVLCSCFVLIVILLSVGFEIDWFDSKKAESAKRRHHESCFGNIKQANSFRTD